MSFSSSTVLCDRCHATLVVDGPSLPPVTQERLRNHDIPSVTEASRITALINQTEPDIARYELEIARLEDTLATLKAQRDKLKRYQSEYKTLLSPIRRLPVDVLLEIFSTVCSGPAGSLSMPRSRKRPRDHCVITATTLVLSQTCSFWRGVVENSPRLWSTLAVNLAVITDVEGDRIEALVQLYLTRSASSPLTLDIFAYDCFDNPIEALSVHAWTTLELLMDQSCIWRDVSFELDCNIYNGMVERDFGVHAFLECMHLQSFKLLDQREGLFDGTNDLFTSPFLQHAPALRSVTLRLYDPDIALPFGQLQSVVLHQGSYLLDIFSLLHKCPRLESFEIFIYSAHDLAFVLSDQPREIVLGSLKSLKLTYSCPNDLSAFLSALKLPSLTTLDLQRLGGIDDGNCGESLKDMILRSYCQLQEMVLHVGNSELQNNSNMLLDILSVTPQLKSLELNTSTYHYRTLPNQLFGDTRTQIAPVSSEQEIALHLLQSFKFSCACADDIVALFSVLKLPSLTTLDLEVRNSGYDCEQCLKDMILRSSCQLKEMILHGGQMMLLDNALLNILSITPHLRSLTLDIGLGYSAILTDELFKALIYCPDTSISTTLIPRLRTLKIDYYNLQKLPDPDILLAMVTSRRNIRTPDSSISISSATNNLCTPLESFKLHLVHFGRMDDVIEWGDMIEPRLRALESEGLTLVLKRECR